MKHGGDILTYQNLYKGEIIDFSSNINPLGPPKNLKEKVMENFHLVESYPDIKYRKLKQSISTYLGCSIDNILLGNGAMEIIDLFNIKSNRIITTTPAFSEYKIRGEIHGKEVIEIKYDRDFKLDILKLKRVLKKGDILILGNPNNPTGLRIKEKDLLEIYKYINYIGAYLLLDEAFYEFVPKDYDSIEIFKEFNYFNVGIIRAATKFFAIPGLRLGYGCAEKSLVKDIDESRLTWSINCFADIAGKEIFKDEEYILESKKHIELERKFLFNNLKIIKGIKVFETHTNYILIKLENKKEEEVFIDLLKEGILVRKCSSFKSLGNNYIRVAIKDRKNNEKLLNAMNKIDLGVDKQ